MTENNVDPYEVVKKRYESTVDSFVLSDLFQPTLESNRELIDDVKNNKLVIYTAFTGNYDELKRTWVHWWKLWLCLFYGKSWFGIWYMGNSSNGKINIGW